jgi:hypothetical protein
MNRIAAMNENDEAGGFGLMPPASDIPPRRTPVARPVRVPVRRERAAPPSDSFRRAEASLAGQISRAVARGQRVL